VLDATPLIYLCKAGLAGKVAELNPSFTLVTSQEVYDEVYVKGVERSVSEAGALKELFDRGVVKVEPRKEGSKKVDDFARSSGIHSGEASVISLALAMGATAIIDDKRARQVARVTGARLSGTPGILIELVRRGIASDEEATLALAKMVDEGWYCSAKVFSTITKAIEEASGPSGG